MNKYYTPKIEEFYVGFEYETELHRTSSDSIIVKKVWVPEIYGLESRYYTLISLPDRIKKGIHRVKYLDREDIESLGFKYDLTSTDSQLKFYKDNVCLYYRPKTNEVGTFTVDPSKSDYMMKHVIDNKQVHILIIKNKSELKKVLQMLKIID